MRKLIITAAMLLAVCAAIAARNFDPGTEGGFSTPALSSVAAESVRGAVSLCSANEEVIFNCGVARGGKFVSLCASKQLSRQQGYLQYRFGRPGQVEMEYPSGRENTQSAFKFSRYMRARVTLITVSFDTNDYTYEIHDDDNSEQGPARRDFYLTVAPGAHSNQTEMRCRQPVTSHLSKLEDVVPNEEAP